MLDLPNIPGARMNVRFSLSACQPRLLSERRLSAEGTREGGTSRSGVLRQRGIAAVRRSDTAWALPAVSGLSAYGLAAIENRYVS